MGGGASHVEIFDWGVSIVFPGITPSKKNSKRRIMRGGKIFMVPSEQHEIWHQAAMLSLNRYRTMPGLPFKSCRAEIDFVPGSLRKADLSNKAESIMDALVDAGILEDDNWFVCPDLHLKRMAPDKTNPRAVVRLIKT